MLLKHLMPPQYLPHRRHVKRSLLLPRRAVAALAALTALLLLVVDAYNWGTVLPHLTYHAYRQRWVRIYTARDWRRVAAAKAALPRYCRPGSGATCSVPLPAKVISLRRSELRRRHVEAQLNAQRIPFQFVDAVDGNSSIPTADVQRYFSGERLQKYHAGTPNARFKVACDLSHFRLMHSLLASPAEVQFVLEDDFDIPAAMTAQSAGASGMAPLLAALNATMHELPEDWHVLHLTLCQAKLGGEVGQGVRVFSRGFCTLGLLYTRQAAYRVLREAEVGSRNVDNILMDLTEIGELNAYVADPPLLARTERFESEIDKGVGPKDPFR